MTPERWQRAKELCAEALEYAPVERSEFVKRACAGDETLRADLEVLLAEEDLLGDFLNSSPFAGQNRSSESADRVSTPSTFVSPANVEDYRIIDFLGEGGMAVVYKAEQQQPRRIVALKMIKPGLAGPEYQRRFEREKVALARLQHPGIARIYDAGTADAGSGPQPYFAMEFIANGQPLTTYAEVKQLNVHQRLELMAQACEAVQHAHQRSVIHRDLKPNNILVDENGQLKVLDFGVARLTDSDTNATRQTDLGQLIGTLDYMSPEQAQGDPTELDTRSDLYSLGVILYELLAGKRPYDLRNNGQLEALRTIREQEPVRLGAINRKCRGDIETIVAKCLEKEKGRRYVSAADLASDIRRSLRDEPIMARPASVSYRLHKFRRRNNAVVAGLAAVSVMLLVSAVISFVLSAAAVFRSLENYLETIQRVGQAATSTIVEESVESGVVGFSPYALARLPSLQSHLEMLSANFLGISEITVCDAFRHVVASSNSSRPVGSDCFNGPPITALQKVGLVQLFLGRVSWRDSMFEVPIRLHKDGPVICTVLTVVSGNQTRDFIEPEIHASLLRLAMLVAAAALIGLISSSLAFGLVGRRKNPALSL